MGKRKAIQRLSKTGDWVWRAGKQSRRAIFLFIGIVVGSAVDRYLGSPVMNVIEKYWGDYGVGVFIDLVGRIITYPVETSIIIFFITVAIVVTLAFWETRDPRNLFPEKIARGQESRNVVIHNETGNHLLDYTVKVVEIDGREFSRQIAPDHVGPSYNMAGEQVAPRPKPELRTGKTITIKLYPIVKYIMDLNGFVDNKKTIGLHKLEFKFHAFDKDNNPVELYIFATVEIRNREESESLGLLVVMKEVST